MKLQTLGLTCAVAAMACAHGAESAPAKKATTPKSVHEFKARRHTDEELDFKTLAGRALLIVNVASM